jgi:hypothetical protein
MTTRAERPDDGVHRLTRVLGVAVNGLMGLLMWMALVNDDPITPQGWPVVALVGLCILATLVTWRRSQLGGWLTVASAFGLWAAVIASVQHSGLGLVGMVSSTLIYPVPYLLLAGLALADTGVRAGLR